MIVGIAHMKLVQQIGFYLEIETRYMPYVNDKARRELVFRFETRLPSSPGELNYCLTEVINDYLYEFETKGIPFNYQLINDVLGALEGAKLEFYRRKVVPYEDQKITENGDVY